MSTDMAIWKRFGRPSSNPDPGLELLTKKSREKRTLHQCVAFTALLLSNGVYSQLTHLSYDLKVCSASGTDRNVKRVFRKGLTGKRGVTGFLRAAQQHRRLVFPAGLEIPHASALSANDEPQL